METALTGIDSVVAFTNTSGNKGRGTLVHISRSIAVLEVYNPYSLIQLSEVLQELIVIRGEHILYSGKGVVTSIVTTGLMVIVSVTLIDPWSNFDHLEPGPALRGEIQKFVHDWEEGLDLSESYQFVVNKMANFMAEASRWIQEAETAIVGNAALETERAVQFRNSIEEPVAAKLRNLLEIFEREAALVPPEESTVYKAFVRRELHPYMLCAPFAYRCFTKPLGYAGDYEMVNMMLKESPDIGNNTYARIFHDLQTDVAAAKAHCNRITILGNFLDEESQRVIEEQRIFTVLSVGCGPAVEIQRFIRNNDLSGQSAIHLMDFNEETIGYVQKRTNDSVVESHHQPMLKFILKSIDELLKDVHQEVEGFLPAYDMIYCAGLFDYFPDNVCRNLVHLYHRWVRPGGLLVTTNVHPRNPERYTMEHLLDWYLIYRDEKQMGNLTPRGTEPDVFADGTGVNVFMTIRKVE
ncbi:MAG: class I SAM-dependent methyltransferase [Terrimicrobiaceae bacterium]|nr:class I SAM-dependent methyltransferase [Terrimicrobiaceae bacterium]